MDAYLQPLVSSRLKTTIFRQKKNGFGEIANFEKYSQNMFMLELHISLCVCVCACWLYWRIVCGHVCDC